MRGHLEMTSSEDIRGLMILRASVRPFRDEMTFFMEVTMLAEVMSLAIGAARLVLARQRRGMMVKRILSLGQLNDLWLKFCGWCYSGLEVVLTQIRMRGDDG